MLNRHCRRADALLRHLYALALMRCGLLGSWAGPAPPQPNGRLIFVCKGNIIRSAYAAARARQLGFASVASAGIQACSGKPADATAVHAAALRGVDLARHRARSVDELQPRAADRLFAFELWQARWLSRNSPAPVFLLGAWARPAKPHIADPYQRPGEYFSACFTTVDIALERMFAHEAAPQQAAPAVDPTTEMAEESTADGDIEPYR